MSYTFLDAYSSVQSADSSVISGTTQRPAVDVASVLTSIPTTFSGSPSISGAVTVVGTPSISGTVNVAGNPSISGTVNVIQATPTAWQASVNGVVQMAGTSPTSILTVTRMDNQVIGSMLGLVSQAVIHGLTSAGGGSYVEVKVDPSGAIVTAMSSVVSFQGGVQSTSIIGGASVFQAGTWNVSVATTNITSIATANGGLPIWSPLTSRVQGTADFRGNAGASIAVLAAAGASTRNYVQHVQIMNFGSASVLVTIADNTTSILGYTIAPAGGGSNYDAFYRGVTNSPITASISGQASVLVSMQGFTSNT